MTEKLPKYTRLGLLETPSSGILSDSSLTKSNETKKFATSSTALLSSSSHTPSTSDSFSGHHHGEFGSTSSTNFRTPRPVTRTPGSRRTPAPCHTPHTRSSSTPARQESSVYVAVVEGRGLAKGEIGMASYDVKHPILQLSQFADGPAYLKVITKLRVLDPLEVIMSNTTCEAGNPTQMYQLLSKQDFTITTVQRKYFNETSVVQYQDRPTELAILLLVSILTTYENVTGMQYLKDLGLPEDNSLQMDVASKYYCLAATAALIKYLEFIQNTVFAAASMKILFKGSDQTTMIDVETILQRQQAVTELLENEQLFHTLHSVIGRFMDIGHLLSTCIQINKKETVKTAENKLTNVIYLKHTLELVVPLLEVVREAMSPLFRGFAKHLEDPGFARMIEHLSTAIKEEARWEKGAANMCLQKCFAVKPKINGLLDISRKTHSEMVDDVSSMINQLSEEYNLPLKMRYNTLRGYYIQLNLPPKSTFNAADLPSVFIKVRQQRNTFTFITADLIKMNDRIQQSLNEIYIMSDIVVSQLLCKLRQHIACLYKLIECVAVMDMLVSFAYACTISDYVRPEFTDTLAIKQGRHPILEKLGSDTSVPNNIYASADSNFLIVTGPNMSGKSTYLRQVALLQIMAQCGSYIPAQYASLRVADHIFSRIGSDDDLETNASTFFLEMKEANYITRNATDRSLIIIDELGRGTSVAEGLAICHAICEHLLKLKAFTFFVTHFLELASLSSLYPNVENYHFEVQKILADGQPEKVVYTHIVMKGTTKEQRYGLQLAAISTMPKSVIQRANEIAKIIDVQNKRQKTMSSEQRKERAVFKLANKLVQVSRNSRLGDDSLRLYLQSLKDQYFVDLTA